MSDTPPRLLWLVPAAMLLIALAPLPYGYYTLLRFVVCISAGVIAYQNYDRGSHFGWLAAFGIVCLLFNPLVPVHLTRAIWSFIDPAVAALYVVHMFWVRDRQWSRRYTHGAIDREHLR